MGTRRRTRFLRVRAGARSSGFALLTVLFVLLTLLVLCTPYLMTARNADRASAQLADRAQARIALDAAGRHARAALGGSHESVDPTVYYDGEEELAVDNHFGGEFLNANDAGGVMWDVEVRDVAGKIDLNSATPLVVANMLRLTTRLRRPAKAGDTELPVTTTAGFAPQGFLWVGGEIVRYQALEPSSLAQCTRGFRVSYDKDKNVVTDGPRPSSDHAAYSHVIDQRAFALTEWRVHGPDGSTRAFDTVEQVREAAPHAFANLLAADAPGGAGAGDAASFVESDSLVLEELGSVYGGVRAGQVWQHATRLTSTIEGGVDQSFTVEEPRWFGVGATVMITDGLVTETSFVQRREGATIVLNRVLDSDFDAYRAEVRVLARRPVNVNTASPAVLETIFLNLQLVNRSAYMTPDKTRALAALVVESRPFTGHEDFIRRVVLPAAGIEELPEDSRVRPDSLVEDTKPFLDTDDAQAIWINALNANDERLAYSTMPFAYTTREVYAMELRASVNAPSGVERVSAVRDRVELVTPQRELFYLFGRQADFDEELRFGREAAWWCTGPNSTSLYDGRTVPPSRFWPHIGILDGARVIPEPLPEDQVNPDEEQPTAEHVFASREDDGYIQLWPSRVAETARLRGHVMHFDNETRDPEGRYLPDQTEVRPTSDGMIAWNSEDDPLMRGMSFSAWIKPRDVSDGVILDVGGTSLETDRILLALEGEDLVLRVLDGFGDHNGSELQEAGEVRYTLAQGDGPGIPPDTWTHVDVDVRGNRPDQMTLLVNGMAHGVRTPGLTRLTAGASQGADLIRVESTEGFPAQGVARIGNELIEYQIDGGTTLRVVHGETGELAGFGGRLARERFELDFPANLAVIQPDHPIGASVQVYGYSLPLSSNLPAGGAELPGDLGPWRVARLVGVEGEGPANGDPIIVMNTAFVGGLGMESATLSQVNTLLLKLADDAESADTSFMSAFNPNGGYAAIIQVRWSVNGVDVSVGGAPLGGVEVIRYAGFSEDGGVGKLTIAARNPGVTELENLANLTGGAADWIATPGDGVGRAFVYDWQQTSSGGVLWQPEMELGAYVMPISVPAPGASALSVALPAEAEHSEFAQLTRTGDEVHLTEWVRYDEVVEQYGQLVRDDPQALIDAARTIRSDTAEPDQPPPGPAEGPPSPEAPPGPPAPAAPPPHPKPLVGVNWDPELGLEEDETPAAQYPFSRAVGDAFRHRGVLGTASHTHPVGTLVLPVFTANDPGGVSGPDAGLDYGRPGRLDHVFVVGADPTHLGWPLTVHRAHLPSSKVRGTGWAQVPNTSSAVVSGSLEFDEDRFDVNRIRIALREPCPEAMPAGSAFTGNDDARLVTRLVKFPSGERPRAVSGVGIGTGYDGAAAVAVPSAVIDEIVFGRPRFGESIPNMSPALAGQASQLELSEAVSDGGGTDLRVMARHVRTPWALVGTDTMNILDDLAPDGGLLRVGEEILAYESRDPDTGEITLAVGGRGLLGTRAQPHEISEPVTYLEHLVATTLGADVSGSDATLPVATLADFPSQGTVLIGDELIHYTRHREGALEMPRASTVPGMKDEQGAGIFRGRYGTVATGHAAGEPVILFPFRYWDRWAELADAPELAYFALDFDQPGAWWTSMFWEFESAANGGADIGVLQRTDPRVPWDADPFATPGLDLTWEGTPDGKEIPIGAQSDRIEWRVFVRYNQGAFEPITGMSHGWKETPRLRRLGVSFFGPSRVLRSVDR